MAQGNNHLPEGTDTILDEDGLDEAIGNSNRIEDEMAELDEQPETTKSSGSTAGAAGTTDKGTTDNGATAAEGLSGLFSGKFDELRAQATDRAFAFAQTGKDRATDAIDGYSDAFKGKEIDELFADAKTLAQKSPAVTIGAATALGFIVARLMKASIPGTDGDGTNGDGANGNKA